MTKLVLLPVCRLCEEQVADISYFIFELLQNADDNDYGNKTPKVHIRYNTQNRHLLIEQNERGFRRTNVKAICGAALSSKGTAKPQGHDQRRIGEKGLGFKSVFSVASTVWIRSGHYSFRFDRDRPLGRILPTWDDAIPAQTTKDFTAILLQLESAKAGGNTVEPSSVIIRKLKEFEPTHLLFLSQIKEIDINVDAWRHSVRADTIPNTCKRLLPMAIYRKQVSEQQIAFRYPVDMSGLRIPQRPDCIRSDLVFVFAPCVSSYEDMPPKPVYAFLPIRDSVFKVRQH
jgi:hypothetical protein